MSPICLFLFMPSKLAVIHASQWAPMGSYFMVRHEFCKLPFRIIFHIMIGFLISCDWGSKNRFPSSIVKQTSLCTTAQLLGQTQKIKISTIMFWLKFLQPLRFSKIRRKPFLATISGGSLLADTGQHGWGSII
jgi:hypothetical protein